MLPFTPQERRVVLYFSSVLLLGLVLRGLFRVAPFVEKSLVILEEDRFRPKVSLNRADYEELLAVPYIGAVTARRILERRRTRGPFRSVDELREVPGMRGKNLERIRKYVRPD